MARIAILLPDLRGGGAERVSVDLANAFADLGHEVEFVLMDAQGDFLAEARQRHRVVDLKASRARHVILPLMRYLHDSRPTALIAMMWPLTAIAPIAARLSGWHGPILVVEHNMLSRQYHGRGLVHRIVLRASLALGSRLATRAAGVSGGVASDIGRLAGLPEGQVRTLYNPIPPRHPPGRKDVGWADGFWTIPRGKRILTVGSLKVQKNHHLLLCAFAKFADPGAELMLLGQGGLEPELRRLAESLGISGRVVFAGFHREPTPFYMSADLFVLSSDHEGFGNVIVEALSAGLPVVSTDCPSGPAEILEDNAHGILTPVGDAPALARAMHEALRRPWDSEMLKARARDFAPDKVAREYLDALGLA